MENPSPLKAVRHILERYASAVERVTIGAPAPMHEVPGKLVLDVYASRMYPGRDNRFIDALRQAGFTFETVHRVDPEDHDLQWQQIIIDPQGMGEAVQHLLPNLNQEEPRKKFFDTLREGGIIQNPITGAWLHHEMAAEVLAERIIHHERVLAELKEQVRGNGKSPSLEWRVAALLKESRGRD